MIRGEVSDDLQAMVRLRVRGNAGRVIEIDSVIDTGFNGFLTILPHLVRKLGLNRIGQIPVILANGKEQLSDVYNIEVFWDGQWRKVDAEAAETEPLAGMALLYGYNINIENVVDGSVVLTQIRKRKRKR
jgi:clan AA aspartic protease